VSTLDAALRRYEAACELIRAADDVRLVAELGMTRQADMDRLHQADERWTAEQHRDRARQAEAAGWRGVTDAVVSL